MLVSHALTKIIACIASPPLLHNYMLCSHQYLFVVQKLFLIGTWSYNVVYWSVDCTSILCCTCACIRNLLSGIKTFLLIKVLLPCPLHNLIMYEQNEGPNLWYKLPEFTSLKKCASFCNRTCTVPCKRVAQDPCKRGLLHGKWPDYSLQVQTNAGAT